jgi:RNA-binding protein 5/10
LIVFFFFQFNFSYRDRAKERRDKYGMPDAPDNLKQKDKFARSSGKSNNKNGASLSSVSESFASPSTFEVPTAAPIENSIGAKMLKQMGWNDGQGLGKQNQGRSSIIEVERRATGVGLGAKVPKAVSGETYKDAVKRTMVERYKALHDQEQNTKM